MGNGARRRRGRPDAAHVAIYAEYNSLGWLKSSAGAMRVLRSVYEIELGPSTECIDSVVGELLR